MIMEKEKIQEILSGADSLAVITREIPDEAEILTREALARFFKNKERTVYLFPETPQEIKNKWAQFLNNHLNPPFFKEILLKFPKENFDVKEINYEEGPEFLSMKMLSGEKEISRENIIFEIKPSTVDSIIYLSSLEEIKLPDFNNGLTVSDKEKIILLTPKEQTLAEMVFEIMETEENFLNGGIPDLLLASLIVETDNFKKKINENALNFATRLLTLGADKKIIDSIVSKNLPLSLAQILGRALARTRTDTSLKTNWSFISKLDFEKAGIKEPEEKIIRQIIPKIKEMVPEQPFFIVLWEDNNGKVRAITDSKEKIPEGPYENFSEAELKLKQVLKEMT